jgi:hypothetical protein
MLSCRSRDCADVARACISHARSQMKQQMENAMVMSVFTGVQQSPFLLLLVRRDQIVEDALQQV